MLGLKLSAQFSIIFIVKVKVFIGNERGPVQQWMAIPEMLFLMNLLPLLAFSKGVVA